jgi:hypothetical protein
MTSMSDELVRWLGEQFTEDERIAQGASWHPDAGKWRAHKGDPQWHERPWTLMDGMDDGICNGDPESSDAEGVIRHMAAHDPARVLREIDVKRRILAEHALNGWVCDTCDNGEVEQVFPCPTLRLLALPYADRPGYREEWAPTGR